MKVQREKITKVNLVKSYGLFWEKEYVNWNTNSENGELLGNLRGKKKQPVNFAEQVGIYILYEDYKLVYVGQAGAGDKKRLLDRLRSHTRDGLSKRWNQFSWFGFRKVLKNKLGKDIYSNLNKEIILNTLEAILIDACEPVLNKQGGQWENKELQKYRQVIPEDSDDSMDARLRRMENLLNNINNIKN